MDKKQLIQRYCRQFRISGIPGSIDKIVHQAETAASGYLDYTISLLETEARHREQNDIKRRMKLAQLHRSCNLDLYDDSVDNGLKKPRLNQLRELNWLDQTFNILLLGPSGTGKTFVGGGLCADAIQKGYRGYFRTMGEIMSMLAMKDMTRAATAEYKRLSKAQLIVIDDIMLFPVEKNQAVALFNFINQLYEKTSFIITTNKMPAEWATLLNDEVLATALLDRLLYHCEIINLIGKSYRMQHRKTIFDDEKQTTLTLQK